MNSSNMNFFQGLSSWIENLFQFLENTDTQDMIQQLGLLFSATITILIVLESYKYMLNKSGEPITGLMWDLSLKMIFLSMALGYGDFLILINEALKGFHNWASGEVNLYAKLDNLFDTVINLANATYDVTPNSIGGAMLGIFCMILIYAGFIIAAIPSFIIIVFTDVTLKILLILAPFAIFALVYKFSKQIFNQWLNIFISNTFTVLIISLLFNGIVNTFSKFQLDLLNNVTEITPVGVALQTFIMGILLLGLVKISKDIADKLGTISMDALVGSLGSQIKNSATNTKEAGQVIRKTGGAVVGGGKNIYQNTKGYLQSKFQ